MKSNLEIAEQWLEEKFIDCYYTEEEKNRIASIVSSFARHLDDISKPVEEKCKHTGTADYEDGGEKIEELPDTVERECSGRGIVSFRWDLQGKELQEKINEIVRALNSQHHD